ncbi:MAG: nucleotidyltransferase domain-containing protein [Candidatus Caldarchaeum sp.]|nr:nucleotidyltransferase domain-containing protein [Candidatus Caldarchaeum sp.]
MREVVYDDVRWRLLESLRFRALDVMTHLEKHGFYSIVYGSVARGDVKPTSDLDVFVPDVVPLQLLEYAVSLHTAVVKRVLVQATPYYAAKAYLYINDRDTVSAPMVPLNRDEQGFYILAGSLTLEELRKGVRKPGIDKNLNLIIPTSKGHVEKPLRENFEEAVKTLGVSPDILSSRMRVLLKRREKGRTGVFQSIELEKDMAFETAFHKLLAKSPALRKRVHG